MLEHLVHRPQDLSGGRPPLLIFLHGVGGNETGLFAFAPRFDPRLLIISPRAPFPRGSQRYCWFENDFTDANPVTTNAELDNSCGLLTQFINDVVMAYGADRRQVFLLGFSQGATLAYSLLLRAPAKLRGAVLMAGQFLPEMADLAAPVVPLSHLTLLIQHGTTDPVVPLLHSVAARDCFVGLGASLGYRQYAAAHEITREMIAEAIDFLHAQLNRAMPRPSPD